VGGEGKWWAEGKRRIERRGSYETEGREGGKREEEEPQKTKKEEKREEIGRKDVGEGR
jgi:hypothetical protein